MSNNRNVLRNFDYYGIPVSIEFEAGDTRASQNENRIMTHAYGFIAGVVVNDGKDLNVYLASEDRTPVYVVHQKDSQGQAWEEDKVILGASNRQKAHQVWSSNACNPDKQMAGITRWPLSSFVNLLPLITTRHILCDTEVYQSLRDLQQISSDISPIKTLDPISLFNLTQKPKVSTEEWLSKQSISVVSLDRV